MNKQNETKHKTKTQKIQFITKKNEEKKQTAKQMHWNLEDLHNINKKKIETYSIFLGCRS